MRKQGESTEIEDKNRKQEQVMTEAHKTDGRKHMQKAHKQITKQQEKENKYRSMLWKPKAERERVGKQKQEWWNKSGQSVKQQKRKICANKQTYKVNNFAK